MSDNIRYKLEQALLYIDRNISHKITVEKIAQHACLSQYHFHRIFSLYLGETVNHYILSRRLEYAAEQLLHNPKHTVIDIALKTGFQTHSAFTRAFKQHFNITPSEHRKRVMIYNHSRPYLKTQSSKQNNLIIELKELPTLYFDYKKVQGTVNGTFNALYQQQVCDDFSFLANQHKQSLLGLASAFPVSPKNLNDKQVNLLYGAVYTRKHSPYWGDEAFTIDAGLWAICRHGGDYDFLYQTWNQFLHSWLIQSTYQLRNTLPFEQYVTDPTVTPKEQWLTHIYIPIEK